MVGKKIEESGKRECETEYAADYIKNKKPNNVTGAG